jgi:hypothetical protein
MNISILSWNICFGCMYSNEKSDYDKTAETLAMHCKELGKKSKNHCLYNVINFINKKKYDFICLQEATNWEQIFKHVHKKYPMMEYLHHKVSKDLESSYAELVTFYDASKFKIDYVKADNLTPDLDGRPYHILFFTEIDTNNKFIVINVHLPHKWKKDQLEIKISQDLQNCVDLSLFSKKSFKNINKMPIDHKSFSIYLSDHENNIFYTIMMGDFNDYKKTNFYTGIKPFKHFTITNHYLKNLLLKTTKKPPNTCCVGKTKLRKRNNEDHSYGDYAIIDQSKLKFILGYENITPNYRNFNYDARVNPTSDHLPIISVIQKIQQTHQKGGSNNMLYKYLKYKNKYLKLKKKLNLLL